MAEHEFHFHADWPGGRNVVGNMRCGQLAGEISIAPGMGGPGVGTNPDEMLLGAAATCYVMTLAAIIERARIPIAALTLDSNIVVDVSNGAYTCQRIVHTPHITLAPGTTDADRVRLERFAESAERHCMVSKALRGNVAIQVKAVFEAAS